MGRIIHKEAWYQEVASIEEELDRAQKEIDRGVPGAAERLDLLLRRARPNYVRLKEMVEQATAQWEGLEWDGKVPALDGIPGHLQHEAIEEWVRQGAPSWGDSDGGEGSAQKEQRRRRVEDLLEQWGEGNPLEQYGNSDPLWEELVRVIGDYSEEEEDAVQADAEKAAELGEAAVKAAFLGNWGEAAEHLREARDIEAAYGDAPVWGPVEQYVEALLEGQDLE